MSTHTDELPRLIAEQGVRVRELKAAQADKAVIDSEVARLLELKQQLAKTATGVDPGAKKGRKPPAITLKTPKGTRDYTDKEMAVRNRIFRTITSVFERHGAVTIDTPVFELKEVLAGKYGEDSKLIYDLEDQGGEKCALRYDLTVPFARFLAMNGSTYQNFKRYHIAKVYRRDQPAMTKGRMREFYQCDFDIAGAYERMVPDAEAVRIMVEILDALDVGPYTIKINHRKLLDGIFEVCGVPHDKIRPISSAVDKLDKLPWDAVRHEMTHDKHLDPDVADRIGEYVKLKGGRDLLARLESDARLTASEHARQGLADMALGFRYLEIFGVLDRVSFDLSLARGLDYYTGVIYEAVLLQQLEEVSSERLGIIANADDEDASVGLGSIAAGGRYDELVGMFAAAAGGKKAVQIPCVGLSIGVERVFSIVLRRTRLADVKANHAEVYVIAVGDGLLEERMRIAAELWSAGINAEFMYKAKPKLQPQFNVCDRDHIPLAVIIGRDELDNGVVKLKDMREKREDEHGGVAVPRSEMLAEIKRRLGR